MAASSSGASTSYLDRKAEEINLVLSEPDVDLWKLRELALTEGGLVNDTLRKRAWPKLVGLYDYWVDRELPNETAGTSPSNSGGPASAAADSSSLNLPARPPRPPPTKQTSSTQPSTSATATNSESRASDDNSSVDTENEDDDENQSVASSNASSVVMVPNDSICRDADQIDRDVKRCTWHLLTGNQRLQRLQMEHKRNKRVRRVIHRKQQRLATLLSQTLVKSYSDIDCLQSLRYYQGYHDVACIFLSSLGGTSRGRVSAGSGLELPSDVLYQVSLSHFRDCLAPNFASLQTALRLSLFPLIAVLDPDVHEHLFISDMEPFFALSWILTWYAHDVRDTDAVKRLFDGFLVSHPLLPVYMAVAMVLHPINRTEVLATEPQFSEVHQTLAHLPKNSSMVGWKYRPGDGYVSDDEQEGESATVSTDALSMDGEFFLVDGSGQPRSSSDVNDETTSLVSTCLSSMEPPARVPFQELLDTAIRYMRRYPPRKLIPLAKRYYGSETVGQWLRDTPVLHMFHQPPAWALQSTAPADWVLKQRARERRGLQPQTRRDRLREKERRRSRSRSRETRSASATDDTTRDKTVKNVDALLLANKVDEKNLTMPMIAMGFGPGDDDERRRRKRRRLLISGAVALAVLSVAVGVAMYSRPSPSPTTSSSETSELQPSERLLDVSTERKGATSTEQFIDTATAGETLSTDSDLGVSHPTNETLVDNTTQTLEVTEPDSGLASTDAPQDAVDNLPKERSRDVTSRDEPVGFVEFASLLGKGVQKSARGFVQDPRVVKFWKDVSHAPEGVRSSVVGLVQDPRVVKFWKDVSQAPAGVQRSVVNLVQDPQVVQFWKDVAQAPLVVQRSIVGLAKDPRVVQVWKNVSHASAGAKKSVVAFVQDPRLVQFWKDISQSQLLEASHRLTIVARWTGMQKERCARWLQERGATRADIFLWVQKLGTAQPGSNMTVSCEEFNNCTSSQLGRGGRKQNNFAASLGSGVRKSVNGVGQIWKDVSDSRPLQTTAKTLEAASVTGLYYKKKQASG